MATPNEPLAVAEAVNVSSTATEENRREYCRIPAKLPSKLFSLDGREIIFHFCQTGWQKQNDDLQRGCQ